MKKLFGLGKSKSKDEEDGAAVVQEPPSAATTTTSKTKASTSKDSPKGGTSEKSLSVKSEHRGTVGASATGKKTPVKKDPLAATSEHVTAKKAPPGVRSTNPMRNSTGGKAATATQSPKATGVKPNRARSTGSGKGVTFQKKEEALTGNSGHARSKKPPAGGGGGGGGRGGANRRTRPVSKKSNWEEGLEVIDELLEPGCTPYKSMTPKQRRGLVHIKNLLLGRDISQSLSRTSSAGGGGAPAGGMIHIPRDLILEQRKEQKRLAKAKYLPKNQPRVIQKDKPEMIKKKSSCFFILEEYAGIKATEEDEDEEEVDEGPSFGGNKAFVPKSKQEDGGGADDDDDGGGKPLQSQMSELQDDAAEYIPHEFKALSPENQQSLCDLLSWDSLKSWDNFDIFVLNDLTQGNPLLFMGWAVLGSPYAQSAMKFHINGEKDKPEDKGPGYTFMDDFKIPPHKLCNYLRIIQQDYHAENPYHNAIHAADVVQALHSMIQMALTPSTNGDASTNFLATAPKIHLFAILLAAVVHDVDHPGKNNAFQTKVKTELAVLYNDMSVLENWHAACAFARMLDLNLLQENIQASQVVQAILTSPNKDSETNLLSKVSADEFNTIRRLIIEAVLHTDMTKHFAMVDAAKGLVMQLKAVAATPAAAGDGKTNNNNNDSLGWNALMYMMHMADISNQAKPGALARIWTDRCMSEFFAQGKQEATLGIPISPNCDQETTGLPESQVGFIKFVVQPAYEVLGDLIGPAAKDQVVPHVQANLDHWTKELQLQEGTDCEDTVCTSDDDDDLLSVDE